VAVCGSGSTRLPISETSHAHASQVASAIDVKTANVRRLAPCDPPTPMPAATLASTTTSAA
jgi:hypothetical protein